MPTTTTELVAAEVRAEMARHQVIQAQLAEALDLSPGAISKRLSGQTPIDVNELATMAKLLDTNAADLIGRALSRAAA